MRFVSTRGGGPVSLKTALTESVAPDGGLYLPERLVPVPASLLERLRGAPFTETAREIGTHLFAEDIPARDMGRLVEEALDFPVPLRRAGDGIWVLELFHGPTGAFKDVGARMLARLLGFLHDDPRPLTVLVATSGDTGGAVAHAFRGMSRTRVVVLYPRGQVSPLQEAQITSAGPHCTPLAVEGTFDDCQRLVREAFADPALRSRAPLTSANSLSVGRLLPQIFYYFHAAAQTPEGGGRVVAVPSGNFGNLTAGLLASRLGMRVERWVAATNVNDVVPEYLRTGRYTPRPSVATISNAMDVGAPSNFERMRALYGDDRAAMRRDIEAAHFDDGETRACIRDVHARHGIVLDPHTAVGWLALEAALGRQAPGKTGILLATAHPAKFREIVEPLVGPVDVPPRLAGRVTTPARSIPPRFEALRGVLLEAA